MSGWVILLLLFAVSLGVAWALKVRGAMLQLVAAAMLLGAAGYALQGRPSLPGSRAQPQTASRVLPLTAARRAFFGEFSGSEHWLIMSESLARGGNTTDAVGLLKSAVREHPGDPALWVGLGNALVDHAGVMTPAASLAFERAEALAPGHPAAPFFEGLALARSGAPGEAVTIWRTILADAPPDASWRPLVEDAIAALDPSVRPARTEGRELPQPLGGGSSPSIR